MNKNKKILLKIEFDSQEALNHFASWLCGVGEQGYWNWMECAESEEEGKQRDITAVKFDYFQEFARGKGSYGEFMEDNTIRTICSRLDKKT